MRKFTAEQAKKILANEIDTPTLLPLYPDLQEEVLREIEEIIKTNPQNRSTVIMEKYVASAKIAGRKITASGYNEKTLNTFLPQIIKTRFALYLLEQANIARVAGGQPQQQKRLRLPLWDGILLQKLLFKGDLERKEVSLKKFRLLWPLVRKKKMLMPLLNDKGIYCFYSQEIILALAKIIGADTCLEIAAGDGCLSAFLARQGVNIKATDDYSWAKYIKYPDFVEQLDARAALQKYQPQTVLCSWPAPKNSFEKQVFKTASVNTYIVIGTSNPLLTGDFAAYGAATGFTMQQDAALSTLLLPPAPENAVYIFRRDKHPKELL